MAKYSCKLCGNPIGDKEQHVVCDMGKEHFHSSHVVGPTTSCPYHHCGVHPSTSATGRQRVQPRSAPAPTIAPPISVPPSSETPPRPVQPRSAPVSGEISRSPTLPRSTDYGAVAIIGLAFVLGIGFLLFVVSVVNRFSPPSFPMSNFPTPTFSALRLPTITPTLVRLPTTRPPTFAPTNRPSPTPEQSPSAVVTADTLNIRSGPGTGYKRIGSVSNGEQLAILGRDESCDWFRVQTSNGSIGWVKNEFVQSNVARCSPPVTAAPPTETKPPTQAPRAVNTATPLPPAGVIINYYAEQELIPRGGCTVLHWGIEHVQAIYLNGEGVQGWDERKVCPNATTVYSLRIVMNDGSSIERSIVVRVQ